MKGRTTGVLRRDISQTPSRSTLGAARSTCVLAFAASLLSAGCMVPAYQLPAGFSGTYHRQLYGMEPVPTPVQEMEAIRLGMRGGIFYPVTAFGDFPTGPAQTAKRQTLDPMILGSDPLSPQRTAMRPNPELETF